MKTKIIAITTVIMIAISILSLTVPAIAENVYYTPVVEASNEYASNKLLPNENESGSDFTSEGTHCFEQEVNESDMPACDESTDDDISNDVGIELPYDSNKNQDYDFFGASESEGERQYNSKCEEELCSCECEYYCDYDCKCEFDYIEIEAFAKFVVMDWDTLYDVFTNLMTTDGPYVVNVVDSITMNAQLNIPAGRTVNLTGGGVLYQPTVNARHFIVDGTLVLSDITLRGTGTATSRGGIAVNAGGELIMNVGSVISDNVAESSGGGVYNNGTFIMNGGELSNNVSHANWWNNFDGGGGVRNNGLFTVTGGEISRNTSTLGGGVHNYGTFTMTGGEIFANSGHLFGGGIFNEGKLILTDSTIRNNWANSGGGIFVLSGEFVMSGGSVTGNSVHLGGGGVSVYSAGTFIMRCGEVSGNDATHGGGGISNGGQFTMYGGSISGNGGGGISNGSQFTMNGGSISGNIIHSSAHTGVHRGAGVDNRGTFTMNGGLISDNTAYRRYGWEWEELPDTLGGGVSNSGTFTMNMGTITSNAAVHGGGVHNDGTFTMTGGTISSNIALESDGGVWWDERMRVDMHFIDLGTLSMTGGYIASNTDVEVVVPYGTQVSVANVPILERFGYNFAGWLFEGELLTSYEVSEKVVDAQMTFVAQWIRNTNYWFTVTFAPGTQGAFIEQVHTNILYGTATPMFVGAPTGNDGWQFTGWSPKIRATVTANVIYEAQWEEVAQTIPDPEYRSIRIYYYMLEDDTLMRDMENNPHGRQYFGRVGTSFDLGTIGVLDRNELASDNDYVFAGWLVHVGGMPYTYYLYKYGKDVLGLHGAFEVPAPTNVLALSTAQLLVSQNLNVVGDVIGLVAVWMVYESHEYGCDNDTTIPPAGNNNQKRLPQTGIESNMLLWSALLTLALIAGVATIAKIKRHKDS